MPFAVTFTFLMAVLLVFSAAQLNRVCLYLSFPALGLLFFYSYTKRFTALSHLILGLAIGSAPLAAWIAVKGEFAWPPLLLSGAVMFWVAGFDVIYALQDMEFDRKNRLFSLPARLGARRALTLSTAFHTATVLLLLLTAFLTQLGAIAYAGIVVVAAILFWEHRIVRPDDLSRVNVAFFSLNGYISILLLVTFAADVLI
jgi:4-hydroxybenzoate polyprenyltransferase